MIFLLKKEQKRFPFSHSTFVCFDYRGLHLVPQVKVVEKVHQLVPTNHRLSHKLWKNFWKGNGNRAVNFLWNRPATLTVSKYYLLSEIPSRVIKNQFKRYSLFSLQVKQYLLILSTEKKCSSNRHEEKKSREMALFFQLFLCLLDTRSLPCQDK